MDIKICGDLVQLKNVTKEDAKFILDLRKEGDLNQYISKISVKLEDQEKWIENYLIREKENKEYYFIILNKETLQKCGTVRIYDINQKTKECIWGSFILGSNRPEGSSYEVIKLSLDFIFKILELNKVKLDVRKENKKAIHIYKKSGFTYDYEDLENEYYYIKKIKRELN
ncbi:MAG: GNAT family N-acetyltransferase [Cetobacterium sp.]